MNTLSTIQFKRPVWQTIAMLTVGFWLSASVFLDWVIMPSLYFSGMMSQDSFSTVGYVIFWNFNRIELLAAGLVLTSVLALCRTQHNSSRVGIALAVVLLGIALVETYLLTPQMSAIGLNLNLFEEVTQVPADMNLLHSFYWVLEAIKLVAGGTLLSQCFRLD
ncbi:DUF4149 domain-containing protein [Aetokthonos hydrillicola Thurmond2011]|jgi:hypothetical protein|uniref:DUF4149 domain-containing protein n=1 Tax=Aetokthonos hydrillicola Thurmond2011 TaxID=2712845 RepID=A0AAP5IAR3_9CYAN|nr:DUF4149 domain-containing protein [Aetokthonos hydrillicola]MBO3461480.1 DUF4149 domain-containing protein [Aetokthonos hydrillicola CCALA 1050]MBW4584881.1 DUF4149 domain-containing protein [Aetokthonos hydrillicola CCALA 1050]MDR9898087.1 DUF4149 domain-containing protein [Aetokthonos hydrillicola Thurmond2011]